MRISLPTILIFSGIGLAFTAAIALYHRLRLKTPVGDDAHQIILSCEESVRLLDMIENPPPRSAKFRQARENYLKIKAKAAQQAYLQYRQENERDGVHHPHGQDRKIP